MINFKKKKHGHYFNQPVSATNNFIIANKDFVENEISILRRKNVKQISRYKLLCPLKQVVIRFCVCMYENK